MRELLVIDVDGTLIKNSVENHFRAYVFSKYEIRKRFYLLGAISALLNFILNTMLLPSKFLTFQIIANHHDIKEYILVNKNTYRDFINYEVIDLIKKNLSSKREKEILLLTGSPELIVQELIKPLLDEEFSERRYKIVSINVTGSKFNPGSFIKQKSYFGFSKLKYIISNYPKNKYFYLFAIGNEIGDSLQKLYFKKFIKLK